MASIKTIMGDISKVCADALVNAANNQMWMGAGVAGAIKARGGAEIEKEAVSKGPIKVGEALATKAGTLKARFIIHAAVMLMDFKTSGEKIRRCTQNSMRLADELDLRSIAFPALGTGVGKFPLKECAKIMIDQILDYTEKGTGLEEVYLVLHDENAFSVFSEVLEARLNLT